METNHGRKSKKKLLFGTVMIIIVAAIGAFGYMHFNMISQPSTNTAIDKSGYQAVFLANGQVYFGNLSQFNGEYMKLTDVYYLQTESSTGPTDSDLDNPQRTSGDQNNATLIKLGNEIHGPKDTMMISKDQLLFFENLKKDSKVSQLIEKHKTSN